MWSIKSNCFTSTSESGFIRLLLIRRLVSREDNRPIKLFNTSSEAESYIFKSSNKERSSNYDITPSV